MIEDKRLVKRVDELEELVLDLTTLVEKLVNKIDNKVELLESKINNHHFWGGW